MKHKEHAPQRSGKDYLPLIIIITLIGIVAGISSGGDIDRFMLNSMIGVFLVFGGFKLIDLKGFVDGYATYDLLARHWRGYGYLYPFLEIAFGLVMFAGFHPDWLLWTEAAWMIFSSLGVVIAMRRQTDIQCVCLGTALKIPLTSVTVLENVGMAALAIALIL
ncbi:MAG: hypothetical protein OYG31_00125 [Candidatus Kaiserbacteria bacterium]|nr:hypothetical protein [Candidatus Kaiserbacteria bacterium]